LSRPVRFALLIALLFTAVACNSGNKVFRQAELDARKHNWDQAVLGFAKAVALDPTSRKYEFALVRTKFRASQEHFGLAKKYLANDQVALAIAELQATVLLDPTNQYAADELREAVRSYEESRLTLQEKTEMEKLKDRMQVIGTEPPRLDPASNVPIMLKFKEEELGKIYDIMSRVSGINFFYDDKLDLKKKVNIDVANVSFEKAMDILMLQNRHFYKVIDENSIIIADDNRQKRQEYQDEVIQTFFLSNADVKEVQSLLRTLLDARKVAQNPQLNAITIRDSPEKVAIARRIIEANDKAKAELIVDVELLQVNRTSLRTLGIDLNTKVMGINFNGGDDGGVALNNLEILKDTGNWILSPIPGLIINFLKSDSDTEAIAKPQLRVTEGEKANLHIGDRIPIPTTTFNTASTIGTNVIPITSFTYQEVGIIIEIEPRVHHNKEITLKLSLEVSDVAGVVQAGGGVAQPIITSREITTVIRLRDGETNLLAGLYSEGTRRSLSGIPGLSDIPILKRLFGSTESEIRQTDIVLTLTPHIIRTPDITKRDMEALWIGREGNLKLKGSEGSAFGSPFGAREEAVDPLLIDSLTSVPGLELLEPTSLSPVILSNDPPRPAARPTGLLDEAPEVPEEQEEVQPAPDIAAADVPGMQEDAPPAEPTADPAEEALPEVPSPEPQAQPTEAATPLRISFAPPTLVAQPDSDFNLIVMVANAVDLSQLMVEVEWLGDSIEYRSFGAGKLLSKSGQQATFQARRTGLRRVQIDTALPSGFGASGNGAVALGRFKAKLPGETQLVFRSVKALDSQGMPIPVEPEEAVVHVQGAP
jgi:general secretion pathway protein D